MIGDGLAYWRAFDEAARSFHRVRASGGRATLKLGDDSLPVQSWQIEGYPSELRDKIQRVQETGLSTMPLAGAKAVILYPGGQSSQGIVIAVDEPRYRPKGLKGGEAQLYMVDEAGADGAGGRLRPVLQALLGWATKFFGKTIIVGDANTTTIDIFASTKVTIHGDLNVTGKMTAGSWQHTHGGVQRGGANTDAPDQGTY